MSLCYSVLAQTGLSKYPGLKETLLEMYSNGIDSLHLMSTLIDIYEEELESGGTDSNCLDQALEVQYVSLCIVIASLLKRFHPQNNLLT